MISWIYYTENGPDETTEFYKMELFVAAVYFKIEWMLSTCLKKSSLAKSDEYSHTCIDVNCFEISFIR